MCVFFWNLSLQIKEVDSNYTEWLLMITSKYIHTRLFMRFFYTHVLLHV